MNLNIQLSDAPKAKYTDESTLGFGQLFTDHMFTMDYEEGKGWHNQRICPYQNYNLDPATLTFHYGQAIFEGLKAYKNENGTVRLFRPEANFARMNKSAKRMCMAEINEEEVLQSLYKLLEIEKDWIPTSVGTSLYIRPFMFATETRLGVHASRKYTFSIILSPSGPYYKNGLEPVDIYVEDLYVRSTIGGTGDVKCCGNYAASILAGNIAKQKGFSQVLWLDAKQRIYIEEVGAMNIFFVIEDVLITPKLTGSILPGITRDSIIKLAKELGITVEERLISIKEIEYSYQMGLLDECFGSGTAAVVAPVGSLNYKGNYIDINGKKMGKITQMLYNKLTDIQYTGQNDTFGWSKTI